MDTSASLKCLPISSFSAFDWSIFSLSLQLGHFPVHDGAYCKLHYRADRYGTFKALHIDTACSIKLLIIHTLMQRQARTSTQGHRITNRAIPGRIPIARTQVNAF